MKNTADLESRISALEDQVARLEAEHARRETTNKAAFEKELERGLSILRSQRHADYDEPGR